MGKRALIGKVVRSLFEGGGALFGGGGGGHSPGADVPAPPRNAPPTAPPAPRTPSSAPRTQAAGAVPGQVLPLPTLRFDLLPDPLAEGLEVDAPVPGSFLLDVREPGEFASGVAEGALLLPMDAVPHHLLDLPRNQAITVYCAAGSRSAGVAHWLREQGFAGAVSLSGGMSALRFGGVPVRVPVGLRPGSRVTLGDNVHADGVALGPGPHRVDVIEQVGDSVRVRMHDAQGYQICFGVGVAEIVGGGR